MTVRLTVDRAAWMAQVQTVATSYGEGLVAVVKGNGYGFTRPVLHDAAVANGARFVCVGTVHELVDVPADLTAVVLTPTLTAPTDTRAVLTVGSVEHVQGLQGWPGSVIVKLASSMRRYGATPTELAALLVAVEAANLSVMAFGLHLPLAGDDVARIDEIEQWLPALPAGSPLWVSHLSAEAFHRLAAIHPDREFRVRVGTTLWHGIPRADFLRLTADVLQTHHVRAGEVAGYHHTPVPFDGTLVAIGAGAAHGMAPIEDVDPERRSPFHFQRQRMVLLERPHMHTTLTMVPVGQPCPRVGEWVDVQRPLINTAVDELLWT